MCSKIAIIRGEQSQIYLLIGEAVKFDFEVERNAFAGYYSCGGWFNGEYFIIDVSLPGTIEGSLSQDTMPGFIRKVNIYQIKKYRLNYH